MPNKLVHQRITAALLGVSALPVPFLPGRAVDEYLVFMSGILVTLKPELGPDMDVNARKYGFAGELFGMNAYARLVPHRFGMRKKNYKRLRPETLFFMSHLPLIGTSFRVMMLLIPVSIIFMLSGISLEHLAHYALFLWLGMSLSDFGHVAADRITGDLRELKRDFWQKRLAHFNKGRPHDRSNRRLS